MTKESRVKKSLLNARVNLIFYFLTLALSFFSRKIFLNTLGADFVGLTGTLQNLLGFLNLAELGIGSAIGYVLYKPLYDHDETKINEIISVFGYLYRWMGFIILGAGCLLACFLPLIFPNTKFDFGIIYFAYFAFLSSSLIGYFANYKQTLLGADQKNYVVTAYFQTANLIKTLIQMTLAYYTGNYYLWVAIELSFGIIYSFILNWKINQVYPWLKSEVNQGKALFKKYPEVMKYSKQLFVQKIAGIVQWQTQPFLIYAFVSLKTVAFYGNYTIITDKLIQLINSFLESTGAGVGNLIAEGNQTKIKKVFWELITVRLFTASIICFCLYMLLESFISLWLGKEYILSKYILYLILINIFISFARGGIMQFLYGYGLFKDIWAPIAEIIINISVAIAGGAAWGLPGILLGSITSQFMIIILWKPYYLYKAAFHDNIIFFWVKLIKILIILFCSSIISYFIIIYINMTTHETLFQWTMYATLTLSVHAISTYTLLYISTSEIRSFTSRFIHR